MPAIAWKPETQPMIGAFAHRCRSPEAGALASWAVWTVDSLCYLDELDGLPNGSVPRAGYDQAVVDVAHARWATSTATTALDLCAASLGRAYVNRTPSRELDVLSLFKQRAVHGKLPEGARA